VPGKSPDTLLERAFAALNGALGRAHVPFMMIGGVAVIAYGVKRLTTDVDAVVQGDAVEVAALVRALARAGIAPRIERVELFARANLVLLMRHVETGVELDVSLGFTSFELEALESRQQVRFGSVLAPMARPEDLVIFKALAGRPKDVDDATTLLILHRGIDLARVRARVAELAMLAEAPELIDGLEAIIARVSDLRRAPAARAKKVERSVARKKPATSRRGPKKPVEKARRKPGR
jgi:predicted nucleotidyltransferase